jgi:hypothetical protein
MNKKRLFSMWLMVTCITTFAQTTQTITVENLSKTVLESQPVVIDLKPYSDVKSAIVTLNGHEIPCQLDDLNGDQVWDELFFLTDMKKKEKQVFTIQLFNEGRPRQYESRVYAEMLLSNNKIKEENKQDLYISSLTADKGTNPYWQLHHHGPAFENELVAYRIYFDHRQTVDIYGKYHQGLELKHTQFYPDSLQKASGFGDDVLWVGSTLGLGTLRGWDGTEPVMLNNVAHRTLRILARGPLRTIVEVIDEDWEAPCMLPQASNHPLTITMTTRYTLYAGRRDCMVDIHFDRPVTDYQFCTGFTNIRGSEEYSDLNSIRGCWGTDWPVSAKDSIGHKRETVGLGIYIPFSNVVKELKRDRNNFAFVVSTPNDELHYAITFGSDNEDFGYHSADEWFEYLKEWRQRMKAIVVIK